MKVKFVPQNVEFEIKPGQSVMHLAEDHGIYVKSVCRGVPSCAECRVKIVDGDNNVFPPAGEELSLIGSGWFIDRRRLACQLQCLGDVTVDMTEQLAKQSGQIGGRKSKIAKAIGDRVEDETVIRDSSASRDRDRDRGGDTTSDAGGYAANDTDGDEQGGASADGPAIRPHENRPRPQPQSSGGPRPIVPNPGGGSRPQPQGGGPRGGGGQGGGGKRRR
ncbi:MAG: 2Fe-2S iron-sulfur cluster-binding protein [Bdellovibrionales bacterium]|nr:2Fe-2S iron-sulfur cluster-binding protein [Bdellovibrionales bacterium]